MSLNIDGSGYGVLDWRTYTWCWQGPPPCDFFIGDDIIDGGHADFVLMSTGPETASGRVLTSTTPAAVPLGRFTARLDPASGLLYLSFLGRDYPLCGGLHSVTSDLCGA
jgi:hypothetical protein